MTMNLSTSHGPDADPNVTPLIDVLLVLLIIFMVIVPITPKGLAVSLPQPPKSNQPDTGRAIVVEILARPTGPVYRINGETIEGKFRLAAELNRIYATRADKVLFVQGDPSLSFASVASVLDIGHAAGIDHVAVLTPGLTAN